MQCILCTILSVSTSLTISSIWSPVQHLWQSIFCPCEWLEMMAIWDLFVFVFYDVACDSNDAIRTMRFVSVLPLSSLSEVRTSSLMSTRIKKDLINTLARVHRFHWNFEAKRRTFNLKRLNLIQGQSLDSKPSLWIKLRTNSAIQTLINNIYITISIWTFSQHPLPSAIF